MSTGSHQTGKVAELGTVAFGGFPSQQSAGSGPPTFTSPPALAGDTYVGGTVLAIVGASGADTIDYLWSNGVDTGSNPSLTLATRDVAMMIACQVTLTSAGGQVSATSPSVGPINPLPVATPPTPGQISALQLLWLRRLLDDMGSLEVERMTASGNQTEFFVRAAPINSAGQLAVQVAGQTMTQGTDYQLAPEGDSIILTDTPPLGASVMVRYTRQTWADDELSLYLSQAALEYTADRHIVYQAGIYAIDTLMSGTATAMDFGEGQQYFRFSGMLEALTSLRAGWQDWLERNAQYGQLSIVDWTFDSLQPGDIDEDPAQGIYGVPGGVFPEQPSYGGL